MLLLLFPLMQPTAWAQVPGADPLGVTSQLASTDVVVTVHREGHVTIEERRCPIRELVERIGPLVGEGGRVLVAADKEAPYRVISAVANAAAEVGAEVALLVDDTTDPPPSVLFATSEEVENLDEVSLADRSLAPKRHRFPQDPYANTTSYTAYTLDWGETKIGLGSITVGVLPGLQIGTVPVLDAVGVFNLSAKANVSRVGPLDGSVFVQYYFVPLTSLASSIGGDSWLTGSDGQTIPARASYLGAGATASLQLTDPWSVHAQLYWARPSVSGEIAFDDLPEVLLPGLSLPQTPEVGLAASGDLAVINLATDVRFNRRDSIYAWGRYAFYGRVRGVTRGTIEGLEELDDADFIVAFGDAIPLRDSYSFAVGYQASFEHLELRVGLGWSAVDWAWLLQAFEVSYRFGGAKRRAERRIRRGYRNEPAERVVP
ncbi:MAG: hypothetical protein KTR31_23465 [Myxococcales bacterium]|nr:hypothetical protein [Myxococcales bacterium]